MQSVPFGGGGKEYREQYEEVDDVDDDYIDELAETRGAEDDY